MRALGLQRSKSFQFRTSTRRNKEQNSSHQASCARRAGQHTKFLLVSPEHQRALGEPLPKTFSVSTDPRHLQMIQQLRSPTQPQQLPFGSRKALCDQAAPRCHTWPSQKSPEAFYRTGSSQSLEIRLRSSQKLKDWPANRVRVPPPIIPPCPHRASNLLEPHRVPDPSTTPAWGSPGKGWGSLGRAMARFGLLMGFEQSQENSEQGV